VTGDDADVTLPGGIGRGKRIEAIVRSVRVFFRKRFLRTRGRNRMRSER
jgi:hypothetical protein